MTSLEVALDVVFVLEHPVSRTTSQFQDYSCVAFHLDGRVTIAQAS